MQDEIAGPAVDLQWHNFVALLLLLAVASLYLELDETCLDVILQKVLLICARAGLVQSVQGREEVVPGFRISTGYRHRVSSQVLGGSE